MPWLGRNKEREVFSLGLGRVISGNTQGMISALKRKQRLLVFWSSENVSHPPAVTFSGDLAAAPAFLTQGKPGGAAGGKRGGREGGRG